jgi:hypothetical protein
MDQDLRRLLQNQERIRRSIQPQAIEILKQIDPNREILRRIAEPSMLERLRWIQKNEQSIKLALQSLEIHKSLQSEIDRALESLRSHWDEIHDATQAVSLSSMEIWETANRTLGRIPNVDPISEYMLRSSRVMQAIMGTDISDQLSQAMQPDLLAAGAIAASPTAAFESLRRASLLVDTIAIADEEMSKDVFDAEEFISRIIKGVVDRLATAKPTLERYSLLQVADYVLTRIVPLILMWVAISVAQEGAELAKESAEEAKEQNELLVEEVNRLEDAVKDLTVNGSGLFMAVRPAPLLRTNDQDAEVVLDINPGDAVELLEQEGAWARVAYYDRIQGQTVTGWVEVDVLREIAIR